jgi:hypothetical protein
MLTRAATNKRLAGYFLFTGLSPLLLSHNPDAPAVMKTLILLPSFLGFFEVRR